MAENTNDNDVTAAEGRARDPDPSGQAAMLLVESLIHGLIDQSVISVSDAVEIVEVAADVQVELALDRGDRPAALRSSLTMLNSISSSLRQNMPPAGVPDAV